MVYADKETISLFGAIFIDSDIPDSAHEATALDIAALAYDYRYVLTPQLMTALDKLTPTQLGTVFSRLGIAFNTLIDGISKDVSPLYRDFPNHCVGPEQYGFIGWLTHLMGYDFGICPSNFGANPFSGFQNDVFGPNADLDAEFTLRFVTKDGNKRRKMRVLKHADVDFLIDKATSMLSNLTPFSKDESAFMQWALHNKIVPTSVVASVKFREKLPMLFGITDLDSYAEMCVSVTDVLRLAVHMTGPSVSKQSGSSWSGSFSRTTVAEADTSLNTNTRFKITTSNAKIILELVERILMRGNTDHETDFVRHAEAWKRLSTHIRAYGYEKRFPLAVATLKDLRLGWLTSWESKYAAADKAGKIALAEQRPGILVRRLTELSREADESHKKALRLAASKAFGEVDIPKLLQLRTHLGSTIHHGKRFHMLPDGSIRSSEREPDVIDPRLGELLESALQSRLANTLPFSRNVPEESFGLFVPAGNRSMSSADVRTSRGDRVRLAFEREDTIRFFLHWKERCDVDMSAVFYGSNLVNKGTCSYYSLNFKDVARHSGDILDGSRGAAEYVDINISKAIRAGIRYVLMNANVYSGMTFDNFPCHVGIMIRDGQTGRHFECSTVETKLTLDSPTRNTTPALFDLHTGDMIYLDLHGNWAQHSNVSSKAAELEDILRYFINYADYRPSFGEIIQLAGSDDPDAPVATPSAIRDAQDEILAALSDA